MLEAPKRFDKPSSLLSISEGARALLDLVAYGQYLPLLHSLPKGDGQPVVVIPGFVASDKSTSILRDFLNLKSYPTYGWEQGVNIGVRLHLIDGLMDYISSLYKHHQRKVSLIGQSLGGLYAREVAKLDPTPIRQVITLGSPFCDATGESSSIHDVYEMFNPRSIGGSRENEVLERLRVAIQEPPEVPLTAIYSKLDGVVHWSACIQYGNYEWSENIKVNCSHIGMGINPLVLCIVADRLNQKEGEWQPFTKNEILKYLFVD